MPKTMTRKKAATPAGQALKPSSDVPGVAAELQNLQRQRAVVLKSRNMQSNRLQAIIAGTLGYSTGMPEKERTKKFVEASALIKQVAAGEAESPLRGVILTTQVGVDAFNAMKADLEKEMVRQAKRLPVASWVEKPEQRGFGLLFLAIVIGETGDLSNYSDKGKLWKRMGCAPWTFDGSTHMGATWRVGKEGKLPASEWEAFGYSPRRRSIAYLIGEGICKQNGGSEWSVDKEGEVHLARPCGPYRARYDEAKAAAKVAHPDWSDKRCHLHGMLLATKRLLLSLWCEWRK